MFVLAFLFILIASAAIMQVATPLRGVAAFFSFLAILFIRLTK